MEKAVILLSGGLDSATCMGIANEQKYELYAISFDYNQRHKKELDGAKKIAAHYGVKKHIVISTNMDAIGGSALTDKQLSVPDGIVEREENDVPITYVPARNLIFLSYALAFAETIDANHVYIGVNSVDYSGYPDCRPEFVEKFQNLADCALKATAAQNKKIVIETPLLYLSKKDIILTANRLQVPLQLTTSCYNGGEKACGICDSCRLRLKGFAEAELTDPIEYV